MELDPNAFLYSGNQVYIAEMYERYLDDPHSVEHRWQDFFADMEAEVKDISTERRGASGALGCRRHRPRRPYHLVGANDPGS